MTRQNRRLVILTAAAAVMAAAAVLILVGLRESVAFFRTPADLAAGVSAGERVRIGGLVAPGTLQQGGDGYLRFDVTDNVATIPVRYLGQAPDLMREGQGVVAEGVYRPGEPFVADRIIAKHDENYMPREAREALERSGQWKGS